LPANIEALQTQYADQIGQVFGHASRRLADVIVGSVSTLLHIVLIPIVTFYFLADIDRIRARMLFLLPERSRDHIQRSMIEVGEVFGNYVRGMVTVSIMYSVVATILFFACQLQAYALLLGFMAGLLFAIPFVGPLLTAVLAASVSLATGHSFGHTLLVLGVTFGQNQVFDNFIVPRIIGHSVGLHPIVTLFALFVGGDLFGVWGMLLSVPVAASIQVVLFRLFPKFSAPTPLALMLPEERPAALKEGRTETGTVTDTNANQ
jgi:predicted PurR-regulated permease PerM